MYDKDGQHNTVMNLYFRDWYPFPDTYTANSNPMFSVHSGEWDAKIKDVMYPHNFPENEALTLLKSMGEQTLQAKILELLDWSFSDYKDKTIEVFFFGIDIATYKNGEIVLKL